MRVFLASRIVGMQTLRDAASKAITVLGETPVRAEEFGASPSSPQQTCFEAVRSSDLLVLILGRSYGEVQPQSGLSTTHEEYRMAVDRNIPVLAFIQEGVTYEPEQERFVKEVRGNWTTEGYPVAFQTDEELMDRVFRALYQFAKGQADSPEKHQRGQAATPRVYRASRMWVIHQWRARCKCGPISGLVDTEAASLTEQRTTIEHINE